MAQLILALSASPSAESKTARVADYALGELAGPGTTVRHIRLREIPAAALLLAGRDPALSEASAAVEEAAGIIVATPIYKAAYSGLLKVFLDQLPQFALAGKTILPIATGGTLAHVLALDYALRPVLQSMGARHIVQSQFIPESQMTVSGDGLSLSDDLGLSFHEAIHHFRSSLGQSGDPLLGHPRPQRTASAA